MSIEETAEHIVERLDELPRSERVRYMETFLDRVKQRAVSRETLDEAKHRALDETRDNDRLRRECDALIEERDTARAEIAAWRYVAQAFRDATGSPAIEARDGEHDPWLERAQNLYSQVANTYGTPEPNRFACATCETGSAVVDEDGCCKSCGADTIPVFDPDSRKATP